MLSSARRPIYRELFRYQLEPKVVDAIREAANGNDALGDTRIVADITEMLGRRVMPGVSDRPRKAPVPGNLFGSSKR